jgi:hypothetical protein
MSWIRNTGFFNESVYPVSFRLFLRKFPEIIENERLSAVSMTLAINLCHIFSVIRGMSLILAINTGGQFATGNNDTGGKFAAGVNDAGGK